MEPEALRALAAPRPIRSRDLHPFNGFYGHDAVLKRYAGLPERTVAKLAIEHGLDLTGLVPDVDRRLALPLSLCFSERRARELESAIPDAAAVAIGPLIRYAERLAPETATAGPRRLVLFPAHSFDAGTAEYEVAGLLDAVADHAASFDEVTACLYWPDVLAGRDEAYRALGVPCVTAGHRNDPAFLFRLLEILRGGAAVATNGVGTHVAYAALLGRPVWVVPQEVRYRPASERRTPADQQAALDLLNGGGGELTREVARRFAEPRDALAPEQRDFVAAVAGDESVKAPEEIAELFRRAEALFADRFGVRRRVALRLAAAARRRRSSA